MMQHALAAQEATRLCVPRTGGIASLLHHGYYAAASAKLSDDVVLAGRRSAHYLLGTRLMTTWSQVLERAGDIGPGQTLAVRLREFRSAEAATLFERCDHAPAPPYCGTPQRALGWRDVR